MGAAYWYLYLTGTGAVEIDFNLGSLNTAMEAGGPMGLMNTHSRSSAKRHDGSDDEVIEGKVVDESDPRVNCHQSDALPHSGGYMASGIGKELDPDLYAKTPAERQAMDEEKNAGR